MNKYKYMTASEANEIAEKSNDDILIEILKRVKEEAKKVNSN